MSPKEAYEQLTKRINVKFYIGSNLEKILRDHCCGAEEVEEEEVVIEEEPEKTFAEKLAEANGGDDD